MESNVQSDQLCQKQSHQEGDQTHRNIDGDGGGGDEPEKLKDSGNSGGPAVNLEEIIKSDIVKYYEDEMRKLVNAINDADSRSISYLSECKSLQGQLSIVVQERESAKQKISELETVVSNYESQMSVMSEHLAALNETLVLQRDQIDELMVAHRNN